MTMPLSFAQADALFRQDRLTHLRQFEMLAP